MKKIPVFLFLVFFVTALLAQTNYNQYPIYKGELGLRYSKTNALFRIWSPPAEEAQLLLYKEGDNGELFKTIDLQKGINGTWYKILRGNLKGIFYAFRVKINNKWNNEMPDPLCKSCWHKWKAGNGC